MTIAARLAVPDDLPALLALYQFLNPDDPALSIDQRLLTLWSDILADSRYQYFVTEADHTLTAVCNLTIVPNLTRSARPYGLIENVVTHPNFRRRGYGSAVMQSALRAAQSQNCYKVMLMTGRQEESTLRFYESVGLHRGEKTAFIIRF